MQVTPGTLAFSSPSGVRHRNDTARDSSTSRRRDRSPIRDSRHSRDVRSPRGSRSPTRDGRSTSLNRHGRDARDGRPPSTEESGKDVKEGREMRPPAENRGTRDGWTPRDAPSSQSANTGRQRRSPPENRPLIEGPARPRLGRPTRFDKGPADFRPPQRDIGPRSTDFGSPQPTQPEEDRQFRGLRPMGEDGRPPRDARSLMDVRPGQDLRGPDFLRPPFPEGRPPLNLRPPGALRPPLRAVGPGNEGRPLLDGMRPPLARTQADGRQAWNANRNEPHFGGPMAFDDAGGMFGGKDGRMGNSFVMTEEEEQRKKDDLYYQCFEEIQREYEAARPADCVVTVVDRRQKDYAENLGRQIRDLGLTVDLIILNGQHLLPKAMDDVAKGNSPFAVVVLPPHELHQSCTVHILYGKPQEHHNMSVRVALELLDRESQHYMTMLREKHRDETSRKAREKVDYLLGKNEPRFPSDGPHHERPGFHGENPGFQAEGLGYPPDAPPREPQTFHAGLPPGDPLGFHRDRHGLDPRASVPHTEPPGFHGEGWPYPAETPGICSGSVPPPERLGFHPDGPRISAPVFHPDGSHSDVPPFHSDVSRVDIPAFRSDRPTFRSEGLPPDAPFRGGSTHRESSFHSDAPPFGTMDHCPEPGFRPEGVGFQSDTQEFQMGGQSNQGLEPNFHRAAVPFSADVAGPQSHPEAVRSEMAPLLFLLAEGKPLVLEEMERILKHVTMRRDKLLQERALRGPLPAANMTRGTPAVHQQQQQKPLNTAPQDPFGFRDQWANPSAVSHKRAPLLSQQAPTAAVIGQPQPAPGVMRPTLGSGGSGNSGMPASGNGNSGAETTWPVSVAKPLPDFGRQAPGATVSYDRPPTSSAKYTFQQQHQQLLQQQPHQQPHQQQPHQQQPHQQQPHQQQPHQQQPHQQPPHQQPHQQQKQLPPPQQQQPPPQQQPPQQQQQQQQQPLPQQQQQPPPQQQQPPPQQPPPQQQPSLQQQQQPQLAKQSSSQPQSIAQAQQSAQQIAPRSVPTATPLPKVDPASINLNNPNVLKALDILMHSSSNLSQLVKQAKTGPQPSPAVATNNNPSATQPPPQPPGTANLFPVQQQTLPSSQEWMGKGFVGGMPQSGFRMGSVRPLGREQFQGRF
uniref:Nuclear receptor coactivator 5 n=1 Tax=Eptatretus burgeri TaxID=7764 RepID=A0A8C4QUA9_EPTBU